MSFSCITNKILCNRILSKKKFHWGQLFSHHSAKQKFPEYLPKLFPLPIVFKKRRDSIKRVDILAKF